MSEPCSGDRETADVIARLCDLGHTVATAESITGGGVCAQLTSVAGSSAAVRGGLVVYATELKRTLAGVDAELLERYGTVHPRIALALATGARQRCGADWGVGVTGVAGPGPHEGVPSGSVYLGVAGPGVYTYRSLSSAHDRAGVRSDAVRAAVGVLREQLA
ncbi:CinA family protein [Haloechinothrix sp. YIM 98757]|uniref:CinA family protein n=1 Tax=Haloechinothrix aidingensis TaxID=2752311 RepID=A0A838A9E1_9PSEU|nr:CinA family protein [Haloechinothrix aidingensis]MBA0126148.1 CinA family protein [Haloechinothrix aidingensis]